MIYAVTAAATLAAGLVHGVTGFGAGIVMMLALPFYFALPQSAGISTAVVLPMCLAMFLRYRKDVNVKKALMPCLVYMPLCSFIIRFSVSVNQALLKRVFGAFLLLLALYYLLSPKADSRKPLPCYAGPLCAALAALCDGLFGIGGPPMVLYFLRATDSPREYLGTLQLFFLVNCVYNTAFRFVSGVLAPAHLPLIGLGMLGILGGMTLGNRLVDRLDAALLRKLTYGMIGVSGLMNLLL